jgi:DNA-binding transcriptional regulator YiaG
VLKALVSTQSVEVDEKNLEAYFGRMSPEQSRAARGWLDWSQAALAAKASVSLSTVRDFEKARRVPIANNLAAMKAALEEAGIAFVDGAGTSGITFAKRKRR